MGIRKFCFKVENLFLGLMFKSCYTNLSLIFFNIYLGFPLKSLQVLTTNAKPALFFFQKLCFLALSINFTPYL